ncbi:MAG TPA: SDR family oxidoreductase [Anaerolineales bacterium]|nr:SDR family oxidoreductase [Anaerolineales bacterium]
MNILIIGGTIFLGRHIVDAALARGHTVTLFNRGQHNPELFPQVEKLRGDRTQAGDLEALRTRRWDAVIDTCGYLPRIVRLSAQALAGSVEQYVFISTISVYARPPFPGMDETAPLERLADETVETLNGETYGGLKALCEQAVEAELPGRALVIRPGLIVGPHDPSDRFTYWPARLQRGGAVLAPGSPQALVQVIDGRDLAEWTIRMVENRQTGIYNATGPALPLTLGEVIETCRQAAGTPAELTWASEEFLLAQGVTPYTEIPLWLAGEDAAMDEVNIAKALSAGLTFRPLAITVGDTLAWDNTRPAGTQRKNGLSAEREAALLDLWRAQAPAHPG